TRLNLQDFEPDVIIQEYREILTTYVESGAISQVNISHSVRRELLNYLNEPFDRRTFDDLLTKAEREIIKLMWVDSFNRFKLTEAYRDYRMSDVTFVRSQMSSML